MTSFEAALGQLPKPILDKLQAMIRRVRRLLFIRGLFATLAVALACLLAIMAIDAAVTLFSTTARWVLSLAGLAATLVAAWWFLVRPLSRKFTLTHMARIIEVRHPELQERISTAVELLASDDPESIRGSAELISAVVDSAVVDVAEVDPKTEFKPARSKKFMLATAVCGGIIALLFMIWPTQSWTLFARALAPFLDIGNAYADTLVIDPGNVRVARGEPVTIQVSVKHKRLNRAELRRLLPDGTEAVERMALIAEEADGTKRFSLTFPAVEEGFDYRVRAGAALSQYYDVVTVDPPAVESLTVKYDYPDYTGLPDAESVTETGEIRAVAHTRVSVTATLNKPAWTTKMMVNETTEIPDPVVEENRVTWNLELKSGLRGNWLLEIADEEGFKNEPTSYPIDVLPDKAPTVQITHPTRRDIRLKPTERFPIDLEVIEDFGFGDVTLLVTPDGAVTPIEVAQAAPVATARTGAHSARAILDIPSLKLAPEQQRLAVQVRVRDNRPIDYDGPGVGMSEVIFVTLDQNAKSVADQAIEAQREEINQQIREAKQELEGARDDMRRTEQELNKSEEINDQAKEKLNEFTEHNKAARDKLEQVAATLNTPLFQEQSQQAEKIANDSLARAQEKADMIPVTDEKQARVSDAKEAREQVEESIRELDKLAQSMRSAEEDYKAISKLNELANRQQELAMKAEDWSERAKEQAAEMARSAANEEAQKQFAQQQQREAEQFRNEQNRVEQQLGEMLKDNAAALSEVLEEQRSQTEALANEAEALATQQEALREASQSATAKKEDQQEALREALLDQLAERQAEIAAETKEALAANEAPADAAAEDAAAESETGANAEPAAASTPALTEAQKEAAAATAESLAEAAAEANEAAEGLAERNLEEAMTAAQGAGESLAEAAASQPDAAPAATAAAETPADPAGETADTPAEEADSTPPAGILSDLALRQETIAQQIAAVSEGKLQEALAMMESQLDAEAKALSAEARGVEQSLQNLQQNQAKARADQAEKSLDQGARKAAESANQLNRAQEQQAAAAQKGEVAANELSPQAKSSMQQGQNNQQQSQQALAQAAQAFAQSAEAIGQTMEGLEPSDADERLASKEELAEGFDDVSRSSKSQDAEQAASQSQQAANSLQQLAQSAMQKMGGAPGGQPGDPNGPQQPENNQELAGDPESADLNETGKKTGDSDGSGLPPELQSLGISAEDWARFKGALVGGNATAIETDLPAEYRELVGRYFQVIAKEAGKK
jgi:hypothetical protein